MPVDLMDKKDWKDYTGYFITESSIEIEDDDYIDICEIRSGAIIDRLTLKTKKGKIVSGGGDGGILTVYNAPKNKQFVGFIGSHSTSLHRQITWPTIHHLMALYSNL